MPITPATVFPRFRSSVGKARFLRAYDAALAAWPAPWEALTLQTAVGPTHLIASGDPLAPAVILLPSFSGTALLWAPNVAALSARYRVYAVDVIGQPGKSLALERIKERDQYVRWLADLMDGLGVNSAALVGSSYGAFLAASLAMARPERVSRLVLIGPAGVFARLSAFTMLSLMAGSLRRSLLSLLGASSPSAATLFSRKVAPPPPDNSWRQLMEVILDERPTVSLISPVAFATTELSAITAPILVLVGEHEQLSKPRAVMDKARLMKQGVEAELVPGGDHLANITAAEHVTGRLLRFLDA